MVNTIRKLGENFKDGEFFRGKVTFDEPMKNRTTMKVGGNALVFAEPEDAASAAYVYAMCSKNNVRFFVLGGGSNLVVSDCGIEGVVLSTAGFNHIETEEKGDELLLHCGSGTSMDQVAAFCGENGLTGMENFSGLPGTCGGGTFMNARCYDREFSNVIEKVLYLDLDQCRTLEKDAEDNQAFLTGCRSCVKTYEMNPADWEYKKSPFQTKNALIMEVWFKCKKGNPEEVKAVNARFVEDRKQKGHFRAPSAGSVFRNNRSFGKPSGRLVDEAGLKGTVVGGAQISPWHGNFIINNGNARASDIKALVDLAVSKVKENTGFVMEPEIIFV